MKQPVLGVVRMFRLYTGNVHPKDESNQSFRTDVK